MVEHEVVEFHAELLGALQFTFDTHAAMLLLPEIEEHEINVMKDVFDDFLLPLKAGIFPIGMVEQSCPEFQVVASIDHGLQKQAIVEGIGHTIQRGFGKLTIHQAIEHGEILGTGSEHRKHIGRNNHRPTFPDRIALTLYEQLRLTL